MNFRILKYTILISSFLLLFGSIAHSQNMFNDNPADIDGAVAICSNPALGYFVENRLVLGMDARYLGLLDNQLGLRNLYINYIPSWRFRGFSVGAQTFSADIYSQTTFGVSYSRSLLMKNLSVGASVNIFNRGFDKDDFDLIDSNDPVLGSSLSKTNLDIAMGIAFFPVSNVCVGLSAEHINQPNIAIDGDYSHPTMISLGAKAYFGRLHPSLFLSNLEWYDNLTLWDAVKRNKYLLTFGIDYELSNRFIIGSQINRSGLGAGTVFKITDLMGVDYRYEYPMTDINKFAWGSHRLSMVFEFDYVPDYRPVAEIVEPPVPVYSPPEITVSNSSDLFAFSDVDSVTILEREINRRIGEEFDVNEFAKLKPAELNITRGILQLEDRYFAADTVAVKDPLSELKGAYSTSYRGALNSIVYGIKEKRTLKASLVAGPDNLQRANSMYNLISGYGQLFPENLAVVVPYYSITDTTVGDINIMAMEPVENRIDIIPEEMNFEILRQNHSGQVSQWALMINTYEDITVKLWNGTGNLPEEIKWDLRDDRGELIKEGQYYYYLEWLEPDGSTRRSFRQQLTVLRIQKRLFIDVTTQPSYERLKEADKIDLILGR